jgi:hypothetical protein
MLLGRRVPYRGRSGMVYFGFVNDLARLFGITRNPSINSGTIIQFSILAFGGLYKLRTHLQIWFFHEYPKEVFSAYGKGGRRIDG